jgi:metallo-beta-lactamase family protein
MHLEFYGAADEVTGSLHRLHVNGHDILLDCGLFQGHRAEANRLNRQTPEWAPAAQALVLSHAHLDHSGNVPTLVKQGFSGNVYATAPTRDLCSVMLRDAAMIQEQDARYLNKRFEREGSRERIAPLYDVEDAQRAIQLIFTLPLHRPLPIAPGVTLTFHNSGHVLGSALVQLDLEERGRRLRLLYTGDLGRHELPLLQAPEVVSGVDVLIMESTYGDRTHPPIGDLDDRLGAIVEETIGRGGRVFIPTFALERAQEVLFALERLHDRAAIPRVPIYIDSPLAIAITEIYKLHPEVLSTEVRRRLLDRDCPFSPPGLRYVSEIESSKALQASGEPCIVIAGSGMCEGGRILHHLSQGLGDPRNCVISVGFMAQHTLGRRLVEGRRTVRVFGVEREVRAQIHVLEGLSAHADSDDLVKYARATARAGDVRRIALVHGENGARLALAGRLEREMTGVAVTSSTRGLRLEL